MPRNRYVHPKYHFLVATKIGWYLFLVVVNIGNIFFYDILALNIVNTVLASVFAAFAVQTWRLR